VVASGTLNNSAYLILGKDGTSARAYLGYLRQFMVFNSVLAQSQIANCLFSLANFTA
jgi:hypothetical protein